MKIINFINIDSYGYSPRTARNISKADMTLAFAIDFNTAGEKLTYKLCEGMGKVYLAVDMISGFDSFDRVNPIVRTMEYVKCETLNVAGNGIYSLREKFTQREVDSFIFNFLWCLITRYGKPVKIISGGQTGVDEAALKFGDVMQFETECNLSKDWLFRDITGNDIRDRKKFLNRFGPLYPVLF